MTTKPADPTLPEKAKSLFGSIRFWQVVLGTAVGVASALGAIPEGVAKVIIAGIGAVIGIGTADSVAEKLSSKKPTP